MMRLSCYHVIMIPLSCSHDDVIMITCHPATQPQRRANTVYTMTYIRLPYFSLFFGAFGKKIHDKMNVLQGDRHFDFNINSP
jgi:hypothetical protein